MGDWYGKLGHLLAKVQTWHMFCILQGSEMSKAYCVVIYKDGKFEAQIEVGKM